MTYVDQLLRKVFRLPDLVPIMLLVEIEGSALVTVPLSSKI